MTQLGGSDPIREAQSVIPTISLQLQSPLAAGQLEAVLAQVGLARTADGGLGVQDVGPRASERSAELTTFEQLYGTSGALLKPPGPPPTEFTEATRRGAAVFAGSVDRAVNDFVRRTPGEVPAEPRPPSTLGEQSGSSGSRPLDSLLADLGVDQKALVEVARTGSLTSLLSGSPGGTTSNQSPFELARSLATSPELVELRQQLIGETSATSASSLRNMSDLSADVLLAAFLKLNITDPNNSVETHNKLHEISTLLRERAIREAQQRMRVAEVLRQEAEKEAEKAQALNKVLGIVRIILCVIAIVLAVLAMIFPVLAVLVMIIMIIIAILVCIMSIVQANAQRAAGEALCDASQAGNDARRSEVRADQEQKRVEEESEIMKIIMESKDKTIEAVVKMMSTSFMTSVKLMSVAASRG